VGRLPGLELILGPPAVSRLHAELFERDGALWLRDLGSKCGTFVNRQRVQEAPLNEADIIHFANIEFRLATCEMEEGGPPPEEDRTFLHLESCFGPSPNEPDRKTKCVEGVRILEPDLRRFTISGPVSYRNLSAYVITGGVPLEGITFRPLQEALRRGRAVVHETGDASRVVTENLADQETLFVQSGDIVKGGRQDRTVRFDTLVPPKSKVEAPAYCVERRRWYQRGGEDDRTFSGSDSTAPTAHMKTTIIHGLAQEDVWGSIGDTQDRLSDTIGGGVRSSESPSSYQLTAESKNVKEAVGGYLEALRHIAGVEHAVGAVIAINGALNRADLYVTEALFKDLWPKLLEGAAVEAVTRLREHERAPVAEAPGPREVKAYLEGSRTGEGMRQEASPDVLTTTVVTGKTTFYETRILKPKDTWVHHGYVTETASVGCAGA
jgi:hypothetical protein